MKYTSFTLSNGLRVIHRITSSPVAYCGFAVDAGTRDELENEQGMAHFVEHMIFKGTTRRRAWHILNRMERVGGDLNAFTNKEETIIYSAFLCEHFARAVDLLVDIVFRSTFPQTEIDKEVEVIIDEIQSYEDSPAELIFDDFEELIFPKHPLGRNILGRPDLLRTFDSNAGKQFTDRLYCTQNMVFFIQGNIDPKKVHRALERAMEDIPSSLAIHHRTTPLPYHPDSMTLHKDTHQTHVMIGGRGYDANNEKRTALYLMNNILGGPGMNSRLNLSLREKRGLVYNVEANLTSYTDSGVFSIYFGCDPEDMERCIHLTHKELQNLREHKMTNTQLNAAKQQIIGQIGVASDNAENMALDMGKAFLHYKKVENSEEVYKRIESLTPEIMLEVANEMFDEQKLSTLIYV